MKSIFILFFISISSSGLYAAESCGDDTVIVAKKLQDEFVPNYANILIQDSEDLTTAEDFKHCGLYSDPRSVVYVSRKVDELISKGKDKDKMRTGFVELSEKTRSELVAKLRPELKKFEKDNACIAKIGISRSTSVVIKKKLFDDMSEEKSTSKHWSINGEGGSSKLYPCSEQSPAAKKQGIELKLCNKDGSYNKEVLNNKGYCSSYLIKDDKNKNNCQPLNTYKNCSQSFSLSFNDNSFEIKESGKELLKKKMEEVKKCIDENLKLDKSTWKLKGITISGTSNGFRNSKPVGEYKDQDFLKKNITGYIGDESQGNLYLSHNALSRLRAKRAREVSQATLDGWEDEVDFKGVSIEDGAYTKNHYGLCPYDKSGDLNPEYEGISLERNNMVYIQVTHEPLSDNIDYSKCSIKHKFYCHKPRISCK